MRGRHGLQQLVSAYHWHRAHSWFAAGRSPAAIEVDFALEAKCYGANKAAGVREVSRLIRRLPAA